LPVQRLGPLVEHPLLRIFKCGDYIINALEKGRKRLFHRRTGGPPIHKAHVRFL